MSANRTPPERDGDELEQLIAVAEQLVKRARSRFDADALAAISAVLEDVCGHAQANLRAQQQLEDALPRFGVSRLECENAAARLGQRGGVLLRRARTVAKARKIGGRRVRA